MKFLRYFILTLIVLGIPTYAWTYFGGTFGAVFSALLVGSSLIYYAVIDKSVPVVSFLVLGLCYYTIAGLQYQGETSFFLNDAIKYFIFIVCVFEVAKRTTQKEFFILLAIGALSIVADAIFFPSSWGRYAGFYINPNGAGFICVLGFALSFTFKNRLLNLAGQGIFVISGLLTFSRYVLIIFFIIYLLSIIIKRQNLTGLVFGILGLIVLLTFTNLRLNPERLSAFKSIFSENVDTKTLGEESRDETWALYTEMISDSPITGNGFKSMQGYNPRSFKVMIGVHNTYLMVLGEAGIIAFVIIVIIYIKMFLESIPLFFKKSEITFLAIILLTFLLVSHNYFDNHIVLFSSLWLYHQLKASKEDINQENIS